MSERPAGADMLVCVFKKSDRVPKRLRKQTTSAQRVKQTLRIRLYKARKGPSHRLAHKQQLAGLPNAHAEEAKKARAEAVVQHIPALGRLPSEHKEPRENALQLRMARITYSPSQAEELIRMK